MVTPQHEFTLEEVLQGKATRIKNKDYFKGLVILIYPQ